MGSYQVDVFCLGIKDAFVARLKLDEMQSFLAHCPDAMQAISHEDARSVILGAIEFAMRFGFPQMKAGPSPRARGERTPFRP
jgi:hypothetical protein